MFSDEEQFQWRSDSLRKWWSEIVADGDNVPVEGTSVVGNTTSNAAEVGSPSPVYESLIEMFASTTDMLEGGGIPWTDEASLERALELLLEVEQLGLKVLEKLVYEWCPRCLGGMPDGCMCILCRVLRLRKVTPTRIRYNGCVHVFGGHDDGQCCVLCEFFKRAFHLFVSFDCACEECEEMYFYINNIGGGDADNDEL